MGLRIASESYLGLLSLDSGVCIHICCHVCTHVYIVQHISPAESQCSASVNSPADLCTANR